VNSEGIEDRALLGVGLDEASVASPFQLIDEVGQTTHPFQGGYVRGFSPLSNFAVETCGCLEY